MCAHVCARVHFCPILYYPPYQVTIIAENFLFSLLYFLLRLVLLEETNKRALCARTTVPVPHRAATATRTRTATGRTLAAMLARACMALLGACRAGVSRPPRAPRPRPAAARARARRDSRHGESRATHGHAAERARDARRPPRAGMRRGVRGPAARSPERNPNTPGQHFYKAAARGPENW